MKLLFTLARWCFGDATRALVTCLVLLSTALAAAAWLAGQARDRAEARAADLAAAADTLKVVRAREDAVTYGRLARLDHDLRSLRDSLKRAGKPRAVTVVEVRPKTVSAAVSDTMPRPLPTAWPDTATFEKTLVGPPADVSARVQVSRDPAAWQTAWRIQVRPSPLLLRVDVGCRKKLTPDVLVTAPAWATVDSLETHTDENLCRPPSHLSVRGPGGLARIGLLVGAAFTAGWLLGH